MDIAKLFDDNADYPTVDELGKILLMTQRKFIATVTPLQAELSELRASRDRLAEEVHRLHKIERAVEFLRNRLSIYEPWQADESPAPVAQVEEVCEWIWNDTEDSYDTGCGDAESNPERAECGECPNCGKRIVLPDVDTDRDVVKEGKVCGWYWNSDCEQYESDCGNWTIDKRLIETDRPCPFCQQPIKV